MFIYKRALSRSIQCRVNNARASLTSEYLTEYAEQKSENIFQRRTEYDAIQYGPDDWLVSHKSNGQQYCSKASDQSPQPFSIKRYSNTHKVHLCRDTNLMTCSCSGPIRIGMACPHIYKVVDIKHPRMFNVRWYKMYTSIAYGSEPSIKDAFQKMSKVQADQRGCIDVSEYVKDNNVFKGIVLPSSVTTERAKQMLLVYCMHLKEVPVKKSTVLEWESMNCINDRTLMSLRTFLTSQNDECIRNVDPVLVNDSTSFDSSEPLLGTKLGARCDNNVTVDEDTRRYNIMTERVRRIYKLCEGRDNVFQEMMTMMDEMEIKANRLISDSDPVVAKASEQSQKASIVSSNAPIEKNPNRGRFKAAYEKKK